jgi:protein NrfC
MLACSLVHEGRENLSLSRIQIVQNPFETFPEDITLVQCRQCVEPACLEACPTGALHVDAEHGNVRRVDAEKCIGCLGCVNACPYVPGRAIWNHEEGHSQKCDLCAATPHWEESGGPGGKQACVQVCPLGALSFVTEVPEQQGDEGYQANLRGEGWRKLGYAIE